MSAPPGRAQFPHPVRCSVRSDLLAALHAGKALARALGRLHRAVHGCRRCPAQALGCSVQPAALREFQSALSQTLEWLEDSLP